MARQATEIAARSLREQIMSGAIPAGARLAEVELAERLSMSRTPVREALSRLAAEGLVELQPNRGARVAAWTRDELREIFSIRIRLEPYAVRQAVPAVTAEHLAHLDELAGRMSAAGAPDWQRDLDGLTELSRRFHGLLVELAGSPALAATLRLVTHPAVVQQNFHKYSPEALQRSLAHHHEIVAAARAGDSEWAESVMRSHLFNARAAMLGRPA